MFVEQSGREIERERHWEQEQDTTDYHFRYRKLVKEQRRESGSWIWIRWLVSLRHTNTHAHIFSQLFFLFLTMCPFLSFLLSFSVNEVYSFLTRNISWFLKRANTVADNLSFPPSSSHFLPSAFLVLSILSIWLSYFLFWNHDSNHGNQQSWYLQRTGGNFAETCRSLDNNLEKSSQTFSTRNETGRQK